MAEIAMQQKGGKRKVPAPRLDFTPMVDLGFILITFFIYTTTISKPGSLEIQMPSDKTDDAPTVYTAESTLTLMPGSGHKVAYYYGAYADSAKLFVMPAAGVKDLLLKKKQQAAALPLSYSLQAHQLHVIIKPAPNSRYEDLVLMLDDMNICGIKYYALVDITGQEQQLMKGKL